MPKPKIISLWGMPGSGKTFWGKQLAKELSIEFIDLDEFIEYENGISIFDMITQKGEDYFRKKEKEALAFQLNSDEYKVLSLGGGTPCSTENLSILKSKSLSLWLNSKLETIIRNLKIDDQRRPLINTNVDLNLQMETLLEKRIVYYKRADHSIEQPFSIQTILEVLPESFKRKVRQ